MELNKHNIVAPVKPIGTECSCFHPLPEPKLYVFSLFSLLNTAESQFISSNIYDRFKLFDILPIPSCPQMHACACVRFGTLSKEALEEIRSQQLILLLLQFFPLQTLSRQDKIDRYQSVAFEMDELRKQYE